MTLGNLDSNNIGRYTDTTPIGTEFSDYLNLGIETVSAQIGIDRAGRQYGTKVAGTLTSRGSTSGIHWGTGAAVVFPTAYVSPPVVAVHILDSAGGVCVVQPIDVTTTGFTYRIIRFGSAPTDTNSIQWTADGVAA